MGETQMTTTNPGSTNASNPWKAIAIVIAVAALLLAVGVVLASRDDRAEEPAPQARAEAPARVAAAQPPARVIEDCNAYATAAERDKSRILRDAVVGGAAGAGVGAAGGAIADGGEGAGKGAGIGAIVGATAGTLFGLNEENKKTEQARIAYQQCMARRGY
jgi:hypothetical protein